MKTLRRLLTAVAVLMVVLPAIAARPIYKDKSRPVNERVADLLSRMTLDEKLGQLRCLPGWTMYEQTAPGQYALSEAFVQTQAQPGPVGAFWAVLRADPWTQKTLNNGLNPYHAARMLNAMQRHAVEQTRLGIPLLFLEECPHGHMAIGTTVFPTGLALAATFDPQLARNVGDAIGTEARAQGAGMALGPVVDIAREPRWSRMEEGFGADPILASTLATAMAEGMEAHLPACLKHFAAYGIPTGGHNGGVAQVGERMLRSELLMPFEQAVGNGVHSVMTSYNAIDGVPASASRWLLRDVLRGEWGFGGLVVSDLYALDGLAGTHRLADTREEAAVLALKAGVDIDLGGQVFGTPLRQAAAQQRIDTALIDEAVSHVLRQKFELGLFENPYVDENTARQVVGSKPHAETALQAARESMVLLKNDGVLPLPTDLHRIAIIGPNANTPYNQLGDYTAPQADGSIATPLMGIRELAGDRCQIDYVKGCDIRDTARCDIAAATEAARAADVAIVVVGGSSARDFRTNYEQTWAASTDATHNAAVSDMDCGEGFDRATLALLGRQEELLRAVLATGTPTVVVYIEGRPLLKNLAAEKAQALLEAWYPGQEGGRAIAEVLFGKYNPAGRLPFDQPRHEGQLPLYYAHGYGAPYTDSPSTPLYAFGYGLSYTQFEYSRLEVNALENDSEAVSVCFDLRNIGTRDGDEVAQLYVRDEKASVVTPRMALKKFARISLPAGQGTRVEFRLRREELSLYNRSMEKVFEPGTFTFFVGSSSDHLPLQCSRSIGAAHEPTQ